MCGFVAQINFSRERAIDRDDLYNTIIQNTYHGPNSTTIITKDNFGLGFNRLKIIDLDDRANQPMSDVGDNYFIVFNGEIYNYKSLRKDLAQRNHNFYTESDTEVLLRLYIEYGRKCLDKLNGMFSFLIIDRINKKIFMARDRAGKKPLFYSFTNNSLLVGSEIKKYNRTA